MVCHLSHPMAKCRLRERAALRSLSWRLRLQGCRPPQHFNCRRHPARPCHHKRRRSSLVQHRLPSVWMQIYAARATLRWRRQGLRRRKDPTSGWDQSKSRQAVRPRKLRRAEVVRGRQRGGGASAVCGDPSVAVTRAMAAPRRQTRVRNWARVVFTRLALSYRQIVPVVICRHNKLQIQRTIVAVVETSEPIISACAWCGAHIASGRGLGQRQRQLVDPTGIDERRLRTTSTCICVGTARSIHRPRGGQSAEVHRGARGGQSAGRRRSDQASARHSHLAAAKTNGAGASAPAASGCGSQSDCTACPAKRARAS